MKRHFLALMLALATANVALAQRGGGGGGGGGGFGGGGAGIGGGQAGGGNFGGAHKAVAMPVSERAVSVALRAVAWAMLVVLEPAAVSAMAQACPTWARTIRSVARTKPWAVTWAIKARLKALVVLQPCLKALETSHR